LASQEDKSLEQDHDETKTAEDRGREQASSTTTSKAGSRRGGRQQLKEPRKKSPSGKSRSGRHTSLQNVSPTPDVITPASDADARYSATSHAFCYSFAYLKSISLRVTHLYQPD